MVKTIKSLFKGTEEPSNETNTRPKIEKCAVFGSHSYIQSNYLRSLVLGNQSENTEKLAAIKYTRVQVNLAIQQIEFDCLELDVSPRYYDIFSGRTLENLCFAWLFIVDMSANVKEQLDQLQEFADFVLLPQNEKLPRILVAFSMNKVSDFSVLDEFYKRNGFVKMIQVGDEKDTANNQILKTAYEVWTETIQTSEQPSTSSMITKSSIT